MYKLNALLTASLILLPMAHSQQIEAPTTATQGSSQKDSDTADIQHLMDTFHQAVAAHDGQRVASLFVTEGSTWFIVLSDDLYAAARAKTPTAPKVRHSSFTDFSKFVSSSKAALNPQHTNVQIHTDGTIGSVYFDFIFLIDGQPQNHGSETWQVVKAADGWKIAAITYSSKPRA